MRIGVFKHGWWRSACQALGHGVIDLPAAGHPSGNAYAADLAGHLANGAEITKMLAAHPDVDLLLDNGATGLAFAQMPGAANELKLVHELAGKPLFSHFIDPVTTALQGLAWPAVWQCLQSQTWLKAVWDRAGVREWRRFGVPSVIHVPMAAPDRAYDTRPLDPSQCRPIVSFIGGQNTTYFAPNVTVPTATQLAGTLAHAARSDLPDVTFYDVYHDLYGLGEPLTLDDSMAVRADKTLAYFNAKLFFHAALCLRNRDRFVIFLKRKLGDRFHLVGSRWDTAYGLPTAPRIDPADAYFRHFREAAINLNFVNGNAETGLNMRHFEITAAGGFMMCYDQPELAEHFEVGRECVVFHHEGDLFEKINHYLNHPEERVEIARAGQRRTLSTHLYSHRLEQLLRLVQPGPLPVEYSSTKCWDDLKSLVPHAAVVFDCGANVGQTAETFRHLYPNAAIYAFEPASLAFETLRKRCDAMGVHPVKKAVGDHDEKAIMHLTAGPESNSLFGFQIGNPAAEWTRVVGQEEIEVCTLDQWCQENDIDPAQVDILKLDVQGAELPALKGARKLLESAKAVYLEVAFVPIYKDAPLFGEVDAFLTGHGYRRHAIYPSDHPHHWGDALYAKV